MAGQRVLLWLFSLLLAMPLWTPLALQPKCSSGKELSLSMSYSTNATGHRAVSANLEQPLGSPGWLLDVEVRTSGCGPDDVPRRSLTITLNGPPEGGLPAPSSAPPGYLTLPGLGHYRAPPEAKDWYRARDVCRQEGGGLVAPTSRREVELLFQHFSPNATGAIFSDAFWVSANDINQNGEFVTDDGVPLENTGFAVFVNGSPSNSTSKNCLVIRREGTLEEVTCSYKRPFICKVPL